MTEAELTLVDLALEKIPINTEFSMRGALHNVLLGKHDWYSEELINEMNQILISRSSVIRDYLLKEKYITSTNPGLQKDILLEKGEIAKREGGIGGYKRWEEEENKKKANESTMGEQIQQLTLKNLQFAHDNADLTKKLAEAQLKLSQEQTKDIPINAKSRKENTTYQIIIVILTITTVWLALYKC